MLVSISDKFAVLCVGLDCCLLYTIENTKYNGTINNTCRFIIIWFTAINCDGIHMKHYEYDANKEHYIGYDGTPYV